MTGGSKRWRRERPARTRQQRRSWRPGYVYCPYHHKRLYRTYEGADKARRMFLRSPDPPPQAHVHWCPSAGGYHVTTGDPGDYDRKQVLSNGRHGMTDSEVIHRIAAAMPNTAEVPPVEVELACPCGEPIKVKLGGSVRSLPATKLDPSAELVSLVVTTEHHGHRRQDGFGAYVLRPE